MSRWEIPYRLCAEFKGMSHQNSILINYFEVYTMPHYFSSSWCHGGSDLRVPLTTDIELARKLNFDLAVLILMRNKKRSSIPYSSILRHTGMCRNFGSVF